MLNCLSMPVPTHLTDIAALFLMSVWSVVWIAFFVLGRGAVKRFPTDVRLLRYSCTMFVTITLFYWVAFSGAELPFHFSGKNAEFREFFSTDIIRTFAALLALGGAGIMMFARSELRELTTTEMVFSISTFRTETGVYRYMAHPMYFGISLILFGSLMLYPSILGALLLLITHYVIEKKKRRE